MKKLLGYVNSLFFGSTIILNIVYIIFKIQEIGIFCDYIQNINIIIYIKYIY